MSLMKNNIACFVRGYQPAAIMFPRELLGIFRQHACRHHILVESRAGLLVGESTFFGFPGEFIFDLAAERVAYIIIIITQSSTIRTVLHMHCGT